MTAREGSLIGVLGGTFDPIHHGHLRVAEEVAEMAGLRELRFLPAGRPRLREIPEASPDHRLMMARIAIQGNPRFGLDAREIHRSGISYSVESLGEMKDELGPDIGLCFIIGADAFTRLAEWHRWRELFQLCHFVVVGRPGWTSAAHRPILPPVLEEACAHRWVPSAEDLDRASCGSIFVAPTTFLDISASVIRARIASGRSVRYLLPEAVIGYISANHLYSGGG